MSFPRFLQVIPNVCLWELKQPDSLSHSLAVLVSPHSLSLSPHKHTHKQCLSKVQRPSTCAVSKQNVLPVEFKICGGWITGFYFLPAMKLYFALKQQNYFIALKIHFYIIRSIKVSQWNITCYNHIVISFFMFMFLFLFYWPNSLVTHLFLDIFWTMVWSVLTTYTTIHKSKTV